MRRALKWIAWVVAALVGIPVLLVGIILVGANTGPGRHLLENLVTRFSGGTVRMEGLAGRFPDALRIGRLEVADAAGTYLTIEDAVLDWAPTRLVARELLIDRLAARHVDLARLPEPSSSSTSSTGSSLPVQVSLRQLAIDRLDIGAPVAGQAVALTVTGSGTLRSLEAGEVRLAAQRLPADGAQPGAEDRYALDAAIDAAQIRATLTAREAPHGLIAGLAGLPDLGAISIDASLDGPREALATRLAVAAGALRANAQGSVDLTHEATDLTVTASAPAMTPRPDIAWQSIALNATVHGPFARPDASGTLRIAGLSASGASVGQVTADVAGNAGEVRLHAALDGVRIPGSQPDLLAGSPLVVDATARLDTPDRPVTFALRHTLLTADGTARTGNAISAHVALLVPELKPLAAAAGAAIEGHATLTVDAEQQGDATNVAASGTVGITGGMAPLPALAGDAARIDVAASLRGQEITLSRLEVDGKTLRASASGVVGPARIALDWAARLADLAVVQPSLSGWVEAQGKASGTQDNLSVAADLTGDIKAQGTQSGKVTAHLEATGLPSAPSATVQAQGTLLESPLTLSLAASQRDQVMRLTIDRATWKSIHAEGNLALAQGETIPTGTLRAAIGKLADLAPLLGRPVAGSAEMTLDSDAKAARIGMTAQGVALPGTASVGKAVLNATVNDPAGSPTVDGTLTLDGVAVSGTGGSARLTARGPADAVALTLNANAPDLAGAAAKLDLAGTLDAMGKALSLASLQANWRQETLRLLAPVRIGFADGIAIDRLRLGLRQAEFDLSGRVGSALDLTASLRNLPADIGTIVSPSFAADGTIAAEARLTGTTARPEGTVRATATGIRMREGPGQALPAANLTANATLNGTSARLDSRLTAGASRLTLTGTAPLAATGPLDLRTAGQLDLAMLDPILAAQGRRVRGQVNLDAGITGTTAAPLVSGTARLANGDVKDFALGAHISAIAATIQAEGETIRLSRFTGRAGPGTLGGSGTISLAGAMPIDLRLTAANARPLASDLMTALIDADLTVRGEAKGDLALGGTIHVRRADIRVPEKLPSSVAVLEVRKAGTPPPPPVPANAPPPADIALNLVLDAPSEVFIRGRGLDVELGGRVTIRGTAANPQPDGGLRLRRGTISIIGQTLTFTEGSIAFTGAGLTDPAIRLVATSTTAAMVATLTVSGSARDPKITLSSVPEMPQDEILAQLLFNTTTAKLSPFQLAQIAAALASLSGATSGIGDPLESLRNTLGLDRLSVGTSQKGAPTVEAGSYLARGVYLGAKQSTTGAGTQATVQIDLAKGLKLETTAGTGSTSATGSAGSRDAASVGLTYQFEY